MLLRRLFNVCDRFFEPEHRRSKAVVCCQISCHWESHPIVSTTGRALLLDEELEELDVHSSALVSTAASGGFSTSSVARCSTSLLAKVSEEEGCSTSCIARFLDEAGCSASWIAKRFLAPFFGAANQRSRSCCVSSVQPPETPI